MTDERGLVVFKYLPAEAWARILARATCHLGGQPPWRLNLSMDLAAANASIGLDVDRLLAFPDFDFLHDVLGIMEHMNRQTGELEDCFLPRCATKKEDNP